MCKFCKRYNPDCANSHRTKNCKAKTDINHHQYQLFFAWASVHAPALALAMIQAQAQAQARPQGRPQTKQGGAAAPPPMFQGHVPWPVFQGPVPWQMFLVRR